MLYLKQSTASQSVLIGPFVDSTDGVTAETGLTIANTDIRLSKNGGNMAAKNSGGGTHDEIGYYTITLDATDTDTVGRLQLAVAASGALPVYHEFWVLEEAVYDDLFGASAPGIPTAAEVVNEWESQSQADPTGFHVNVLEIGGTAQTANDNGADINAILVDTAEIGAAGAGLTAVPWNAAWDAEVESEATDALNAYDPPTKAELDSGLAGLNDPTAAAIAGAVLDEDMTGHQTTGTLGAAIGDGDAGAGMTEAGGTGDHLTAIDLPNQTMDITGDITGNLSGSVGSVTAQVTADVTAISGDTTAADRLEALMDGTIVAQVNDASASTTAFIADGFTEATDDHFNGRLITFITGALAGQQTDITDYTGSTQTFTVSALTEAPSNDDFFVIH